MYELLREILLDGEKFVYVVEYILEREENWILWKNEGCLSFIKERSEEELKS